MSDNTKCPFCSGDGCCYCDHSGKVSIGDSCLFRTMEEAKNHNPEVSGFDYEIQTGRRDLVTGKLRAITQ